VCTYTYAPLCAVRGNTGVEKEETLLPSLPHRVSRPPVTCSPLILFSLTVPVVFLSPSTPCSSALLASYSLFLRQSLSFCLCSLISFLHLSHFTLSFLSVFLSSSFIRVYASRIAYRSSADTLLLLCCSCWWNLKVHAYLRAKEKDAPFCEI